MAPNVRGPHRLSANVHRSRRRQCPGRNRGSGATSFRREYRVPLGGPDGGDGGRGGDVFVRADENLATLLDYTYRDSWVAERGEHGMGSNKTGRSGADVILPVPPGTVVSDVVTGERLGEVLDDGESSTRRAGWARWARQRLLRHGHASGAARMAARRGRATATTRARAQAHRRCRARRPAQRR